MSQPPSQPSPNKGKLSGPFTFGTIAAMVITFGFMVPGFAELQANSTLFFPICGVYLITLWVINPVLMFVYMVRGFGTADGLGRYIAGAIGPFIFAIFMTSITLLFQALVSGGP
jgi:hypothetical protein